MSNYIPRVQENTSFDNNISDMIKELKNIATPSDHIEKCSHLNFDRLRNSQLDYNEIGTSNGWLYGRKPPMPLPRTNKPEDSSLHYNVNLPELSINVFPYPHTGEHSNILSESIEFEDFTTFSCPSETNKYESIDKIRSDDIQENIRKIKSLQSINTPEIKNDSNQSTFSSIIFRVISSVALVLLIFYSMTDLLYIYVQTMSEVRHSYKHYGCTFIVIMVLLYEVIYFTYNICKPSSRTSLGDIINILSIFVFVVCYSALIVQLKLGFFYDFVNGVKALN